MSLFNSNPSGLPYCSICFGNGCFSCEKKRKDQMRRITTVDGFLAKHLKGQKLTIDNNEQLIEILYAAIEFGRNQVKSESTLQLPEEDTTYDRFANLDYLPRPVEAVEAASTPDPPPHRKRRAGRGRSR